MAGKIAGSNFEHQRYWLMARRAEGRTPGVTRTVRHVDASIRSVTASNLNLGELAEWLAKLQGAILNISVIC